MQPGWFGLSGLCLVTFAVLFLSILHETDACGAAVHAEICYRALQNFKLNGQYPEYVDIIERNQGALQAGAAFPDWGYWSGHSDGSEFAHWAYFSQGIAGYLHANTTRPWAPNDEQLVALVFGATCHAIADVIWHGLSGKYEYSFIGTLGNQNFQTSRINGPCYDGTPTNCWSTSHSTADTGGDLALSYEYGLPWITEWQLPADTLQSLYQQWINEYPELFTKDRNITAADITAGVGGLYAEVLVMEGTSPGVNAGRLLFGKYDAPFLVEHLNDHFSGGVDDMSVWALWVWTQLIQFIENGPPAPASWDSFRRKALDKASVHVRKPRGLKSKTHSAQHRGRRYRGRLVSKSDADTLVRVRTNQGVASFTPKSRVQPEPKQHDLPTTSSVGERPFDQYGTSLASGDLNNDGILDIVVGAPCHSSPNQTLVGKVYIRDASGRNQSEIPGRNTYQRFGQAVAVVDWNGDGLDDLVVSAPWNGTQGATQSPSYVPRQDYDSDKFDIYSGQRQGEVYIYLQDKAEGLPSSPSVTVTSNTDDSMIGYKLSSEDLDGDGHKDLIIQSPYARDPVSQLWEVGTVHVFLSTRHSETVLSIDTADWSMSGTEPGEWCGYDVTFVKDTSGTSSLVVGCPSFGRSDPSGSQSVLDSAGRVFGFVDTSSDNALSLTLNFTLTGTEAWAQTGHTLASGNIEGPGGQTSLFVSSPTSNSSAGILGGSISVIDLEHLYGQDIDLTAVPTRTRLEGKSARARLGHRLGLADLNGDGIQDLYASEPWQNGGKLFWTVETGGVYAWYGGQSFPKGNIPLAGDFASLQLAPDTAQARYGLNLIVVGKDLVVASHQTSSLEDRLAGRVDVVAVVENKDMS